MARRTEGYRSRRLAARRGARSATWQNVVLYVLAGVVAFAAVIGAVRLSRYLTTEHVRPSQRSYIALVTVGRGEAGREPIAGLLVRDAAHAESTFYIIPRTTLLTGPQGEYIMAVDAMRSDGLNAFVERLIHAPVDYRVDLSYGDLTSLAGGESLFVDFARPATLQIGGAWQTYKGDVTLPATSVADVLSAQGQEGPEEGDADLAVFEALFRAAALRSQAERDAAIAGIVRDSVGIREDDARDILAQLGGGRTTAALLPARGFTAEGQFAYRPDADQIMARITRVSPGHRAKYTVQVENGSGVAGIAQLAAERLATLDVNIPPVGNADSFSYRQTQIVAGSGAVGVAEDIRAILGRGVVLSGRQLPAETVVVIVGKDLKAKDLQ